MSAQPASPSRPWALIGWYVLFFMTVGVSLPFMPGYFKTLGFSGAEAGTLLSVGPTFALFMPPLWGQLADRTRRPGLILFITSAGGAVGYALLARAETFTDAFVALCLHAAFASSLVSLIDTLAMHHVQEKGGTYAGIRIWGSLGFVLTALPFGFLVKNVDRATVLLPLVLLTTAAIWAGVALARVQLAATHGPKPTVGNALALLRRREIALFLVATCLHWISCAPYHGSLAPHVKDLGLPAWVVGVSASFGVLSEIVVMFTWPRWSARFPARTLLAWCFGLSAIRWALMALTANPLLLSAIALFHGFTFGAFYLAAVAHMAEQAPGSLRATAQAMFAAATFGVGGVIGYRVSGALYDRLGGSTLFLIAAGMALLPLVPLAFARPREPSELQSIS